MRKILLLFGIIAALLFLFPICTTSNQVPQNGATADSDGYQTSDELWIDTVMFAKGHVFGYRGDMTDWGGWYIDTIFVGDDNMLQYDSVGPSTFKLSLITKTLIADLGDSDVADKIKEFMKPINGFTRFKKSYEECLDSVVDEEYGTSKYMGYFSFVADYPDSSMINATKINRFICELTEISENEKATVPGLSAFYAGFNKTKNYRPVYTGNVVDILSLSDFLANKFFENRKRSGDFSMGSNAATLAIKPHIITDKFVTFSMFEHEREGAGHGMYTETFHTFNLKTGKKLQNNDIFKSQYLDQVKKQLFEVMAKDSNFLSWHDAPIPPMDIEGMIEVWQSPSPALKGIEWEEPEVEFNFQIPNGALTDSGVVFSFQPYEISGWAAGAFHFIVPYSKLQPYLTATAKGLINN